MIEYIKIPDNAVVPVYCTLCHEEAYWLVQYNKKRGGHVHFFVCQDCAKKIFTDIKNGKVREKFVPPVKQ